MLGFPKYKRGDIVRFSFGDDVKRGTIEIIDAHGTFEDNSDVSYDIMGIFEGELTLFKHINEQFVIEKIGEGETRL